MIRETCHLLSFSLTLVMALLSSGALQDMSSVFPRFDSTISSETMR